jgi:hypothetical protein
VKQRRRNHPNDFPFSVVAALDANHATELKIHDLVRFTAHNKQCSEFTEKRLVADDHHVAAELCERLFSPLCARKREFCSRFMVN